MSFLNKYKERIIVAIVAIILVIIIGITSGERLGISKFEGILGNILTPISKFTSSISKKTSDFIYSITNIGDLKNENEELKERILALEEENRTYENIIGKADYLKNEADLVKNSSFDLIEGTITAKEPTNWFNRFTIDIGYNDGVKKGDTVVQGTKLDQNTVIEGVVGRIVDVGPSWSNVVSLVDEQNRISFKVLRTQDGGIIHGSLDGKVSGYLFDDEADVIKGDKLFTSGLGGTFIKDIYIGEIEDIISGEESLVKSIEIKPAIDFKKMSKVFVISKEN